MSPPGVLATEATPLGDDVWQLDTRMAGVPGVVAAYLIATPQACLVETGAGISAPTVLEALQRFGIGPADLATIVVTHIHLDHAGAVGALARAFPSATVVVHAAGARHLADPTRLLASATRVYGPDLDRLFGTLEPTPPERLRAVADVPRPARIDLGGGRALLAYDSPGHARHHLGLLDTDSGDLYVGDAAGIWIEQTGSLRPATPPPDFRLDQALASLDLFAQLSPRRLLFSHFGATERVTELLDRAGEELTAWVETVRAATAARGPDLDHAVALVRAAVAAREAGQPSCPEVTERFEWLSSTEANVSGILGWLARAQPSPEPSPEPSPGSSALPPGASGAAGRRGGAAESGTSSS